MENKTMIQNPNNEVTEKILEKHGVTIYSHGDFDGMCSAALFISAFCPPDVDLIINDVNYDKDKWQDYPFDKNRYNVVLDFPCAKELDFWSDHHKTSDRKTKLEEKFQPIYSVLDENAPSCVHALGKFINDKNKSFVNTNKEQLKKFIYWANVIDAAKYDNVMQVMKPTDNSILLDLCYNLLRKPYDYFVLEMVKSGLDVDEMFKRNPLFQACGSKKVSENWKSFFYIKEHGQCTTNGLVIVDLIGSSVSFARYAPWLAFEDKFPKICMTSYNLGKNGLGISLSCNPFMKSWKSEVDLSKIAEKFGGGGHQGAAGINCKDSKKTYEVMQEAGEMIEKIL